MNSNLLKTGKTEPFSFAIYIGFFAGLFGSIIRFIAHWFRFTQFDNSFLIYDWFVNLGRSSIVAVLLGSISFIIFSIISSVIYMLLLRTKAGLLWGLLYGVIWWTILFIVSPLLISWPTTDIVLHLDSQVFELCFMLVWGLFIGFSIAFEFTDEASHEPIYAK